MQLMLLEAQKKKRKEQEGQLTQVNLENNAHHEGCCASSSAIPSHPTDPKGDEAQKPDVATAHAIWMKEMEAKVAGIHAFLEEKILQESSETFFQRMEDLQQAQDIAWRKISEAQAKVAAQGRLDFHTNIDLCEQGAYGRSIAVSARSRSCTGLIRIPMRRRSRRWR
jgi:hypothetical protein